MSDDFLEELENPKNLDDDLYDDELLDDFEDYDEDEDDNRRYYGLLFFIGLYILTLGASYIGFRVYSHFKSLNMYTDLHEMVDPDSLGDKEDEEVIEIMKNLYIYNADLCGYIYLPNTSLNYPVVQTAREEGMYYMRRDFSGWPSVLGTPFADYRTLLRKNTEHIIIYGHTPDTGHYMFGTLLKYKENSFFANNKVIELTTMEGVMHYRIVLAASVSYDNHDAYYWTQAIDPYSQSARENLDYLYNIAFTKDSGFVFDNDDQFLTLVSCEQLQQNQRIIVVYEKIK